MEKCTLNAARSIALLQLQAKYESHVFGVYYFLDEHKHVIFRWESGVRRWEIGAGCRFIVPWSPPERVLMLAQRMYVIVIASSTNGLEPIDQVLSDYIPF